MVMRFILVLYTCMFFGLLGSFYCSDMSLLSIPPHDLQVVFQVLWGFQILVMVHLTVLKIFESVFLVDLVNGILKNFLPKLPLE